MWIGIIDEIDGMLENDVLAMRHSDTMLIYSDGITEAYISVPTEDNKESKREMFGEERLKNSFQKLGDVSAVEIKTGILKQIDGYKCDDDVTLVVLKRMK